MVKGKLYIIPTTLGETEVDNVIPGHIKSIINTIDEYVVENEKIARRYLKKLGIIKSLNDIILHPLNEHTDIDHVVSYLKSIDQGKNIGILSDAGCPAIADPGAEIIKLAHQKNIQVIPLVGPSSILLALMASGLNGQSFCFHGYLPKERNERIKKLKELEKTANQKNETQLFIEAPYRNQHLLEDIIANCNANTQLCIACNISLSSEFIQTKTISAWKQKLPEINKKPTVFLIK